MKEVSDQIIGALVVVAILLAGTWGAYIILKPVGQAYYFPESCSCGINGMPVNVLYKEGFAFMPDGTSRFVGHVEDSEFMCSVVCASIGGYALGS